MRGRAKIGSHRVVDATEGPLMDESRWQYLLRLETDSVKNT